MTLARKLLAEHRAKQAGLRFEVGTNWMGAGTEQELVFTTRTGRPIEPRNLYRSFIKICTKHGIRRIKVHGLRHTNATTLKNLNVPGRDIQAILGHSSMRTTGIYEHTDMARKQDALEKVEIQFFGESTAAYNRGRRCQPQISKEFIVDHLTTPASGGPGGIRTHDTRLKRPLL